MTLGELADDDRRRLRKVVEQRPEIGPDVLAVRADPLLAGWYPPGRLYRAAEQAIHTWGDPG